jgi:hypothetical protein
MKKFLLLLVLSTITTNLFSQTDSTKISFIAYWSMGDSYNFKISKIRQQWEEGKLTKDQQQEYIANFTVIDSTENSYTIKWSYEIDLVNTYQIPEKFLSKLSKYQTTEITYKTTEFGDLIEVLNWKEVGETMNKMVDDIIEVIEEEDVDKQDALKNAMKPFKEIYNTQQGIEELILKELRVFHFPMGTVFTVTEPIYYEEELPNVLGGKPIKAKTKLLFEDIDFDENFCVIKQEMSLDQEDTRAVLEQLFSKMNQEDRVIKEALKTAVFEINDKNTYEYYYDPGIPHKIETVREALIDIDKQKGKRIDKIRIELLYDN